MGAMSEPKKSLGQHWLYDKEALDYIVAAAELSPKDTVVEIGPGLGTLTEKLLATGAQVIAIEFDEELLGPLRARFEGTPNFHLEHADILRYDFSNLPSEYKIAANIPYYLTSHLMRQLTDSITPPNRAVLLVQKEVAERICASPNDMSILTVAVQIEFRPTLGLLVPAALFVPPPKVDSQVIVLEKRQAPLNNDIDKDKFMRVVKAGFSAKRKTLRNTISAGLQMSKTQAESVLEKVGIDAGRRAETLTLDEWYKLSQQIEQS